MALIPTGSIKLFMDQLVVQEELVHGDLRVYRWRPLEVEAPALYNWITDAPFEQRDLARWRDTLNLSVRIAMLLTDPETMYGRLEEYADAFREVMDPAFDPQAQGGPLAGTATRIARTGMRMVPDRFTGQDYLAIEFSVSAQLDRFIHAT
jgi:hypothetical protein